MTLVGIHSRPDYLIKASRDLDRGRVGEKEFLNLLRISESEIIELQSSLGFEPVIDGMFRWQDIFRPLTRTISGLSAGPLSRFFDNNTFFRRPVVGSKLEYVGGMEDYFRGEKLILPGPYTFLRSCEDRNYRSKRELIKDYVHCLEEITDDLKPTEVQINEPWLVYKYRRTNPDDEDLRAVAECSETLRASIHLYFGDCSSVAESLSRLGVKVIGVDLIETQPEGLKGIDSDLILGIVDSRNTLMENEKSLLELIEPFEGVYAISPNCDLEFLPYNRALRKMELLSRLRGEVS